jgi:hypothetical protein
MRRVGSRSVVRGAAVVVLSVVLAMGAFASPRETRERGPREKANPIVKLLKKIASLGDGLVVPTP